MLRLATLFADHVLCTSACGSRRPCFVSSWDLQSISSTWEWGSVWLWLLLLQWELRCISLPLGTVAPAPAVGAALRSGRPVGSTWFSAPADLVSGQGGYAVCIVCCALVVGSAVCIVASGQGDLGSAEDLVRSCDLQRSYGMVIWSGHMVWRRHSHLVWR